MRHLVLPDGLAGTAEVARFLAEQVSRDTYLNVMDQYRPAFKVAPRERGAPDLGEWAPPSAGEAVLACRGILRPATAAEYQAAVAEVRAAGLWRLDGREPGS